MNCKLTLFIPQLFRPPQPISPIADTDQPVLPVLTRLLSRAQPSIEARADYTSTLFRQFDLTQSSAHDLPVAAVRHVAMTAHIDQGWWICIDPIHIQVDRHALVPMAHTELEISTQESEQLVQALREHFQDEGWQIEAMTPHHWLLKSHKKTDIHTTPLHEVMYRNMNDRLPTGTDATYWHGVLNEIQMVLHHHPVNAARAEHGQLPVNSVWLWGSGSNPEPTVVKWQKIFADDPFVRGLAVIANVTLDTTKQFFTALDGQDNENILLVLNDCQLAQDNHAWYATLAQLEQQWFQPLLDNIKNHSLSELSIISGDGRQFQLQANSLRRWWRRTKTIDYWLDKHDQD